MVLISVICGVIFLGVGYVRDDLLIPFSMVISTKQFSFFPTANAIAQGPWILGAALVGNLFRTPGSAVFGQAVSSVFECFTGGVSGIRGMLSGILEGFGSEVGFACYRYHDYTWVTFVITSFLTDLITFAYDVVTKGYYQFSWASVIVAFIVQFLSIFVFSYYLNRGIYSLLKRSHVLSK